VHSGDISMALWSWFCDLTEPEARTLSSIENTLWGEAAFSACSGSELQNGQVLRCPWPP
jgi:hypothetical protein